MDKICKDCGIVTASPLTYDRKYNQMLCESHFNNRRAEATKAGDYEWFQANELLDQITEDERFLLGV